MASVGYGSYNFGIAVYGTPQYQVATATIAQTSGASAIGRQLDRGVATIAQTSGMSAIGRQVDRGSATLAQTSGMSAVGIQIDLGSATCAYCESS